MRTHHCLTLFLCGAFLLGSLKADAQTPGAGTATFQSHAPIDPSSIPAGFNPYPAISPFEHAFTSTYNERGQWLRETSNDMQLKSYFSLEAIVARFKGPSSAEIGTSNVFTPFFDIAEFAIQNDDLGRSTGGEFVGVGVEYNKGEGAFPGFDTGLLDSSHGTGLQGTFGIERKDGIGLEFSGLWIGPQWERTSTGFPIQRFGNRSADAFVSVLWEQNQIPYDIDTYPTYPSGLEIDSALDVVDVDNITVANPGIGLNDGSILGTIQKFDLYMQIQQRSELYGAQVTLLQTPSRQVGPFTVRPTMGVRYINTNEQFTMEGHDSGGDFDINPVEGTIEDAAIYGGVETDFIPIRDPIRAYIDSSSETNLGGPELGWRYNAGGDSFQLTGETKFGVMGANEKTRLWTKGIGQPYLFNQSDPTPLTNFNFFYDPELETIDTNASAFVTPTFQQSFNTTTKPFGYVPILRNYGLFREANFKAGWTFLLIGQLQRPNNQIVYQSGNGAIPPGELINPISDEAYGTPTGDPTLQPILKKDRSLYFVNYFNFGVEWEF
ncbi:MAG: hypothetical protein HUJ26_19205 [Planctomycetaceae bacterium]|nr:hypothetical protein [Planctomycetaceae bacterium]